MNRYLFLFSMTFISLNSSANIVSPLSKYSYQWDLDFFRAANTAEHTTFLSQEEKTFIYILNLARMSPVLFSKTVLIPYAQKNGYSTELLQTIQLMSSSEKFALIKPDEFFCNETQKWIQSEKIKSSDGIRKLDSIYNINPLLKNKVLIFTKYLDLVDLICKLIADPISFKQSFRYFLLTNYATLGISISEQKDKKCIGMIFSENTLEQLTNRNKPNSNNHIKVIPTRRKDINLIDNPKDSILNFFKNDTGLNLSSYTLVSEQEFHRIKDSIQNENISFSDANRNYQIKINNKKYYFKQLYPKKQIPLLCIFYDDGSQNTYDAAHLIKCFYLQRKASINNDGYDTITLKKVETKAPLPFFNQKIIGEIPPIVDNNKIDKYAKSINGFSVKKLAYDLTDQWKNNSEKVRSIYTWMRAHIKYDFGGLESGKYTNEPTDVLRKKAAICMGYAELFSALCNEAKINTELITGLSYNESSYGSHAWNAVQIDGRWYLIDVTWGDEFYLTSPKFFFQTHYPQTNRWTLFTEYYSMKQFLNSKK